MPNPLHPFIAALTAACAAGAMAATPAADAAKTGGATAGERCEAAVAETVRRLRGRDAQEVEFVGARRAVTPPVDDEETGVKGEGRYRGARGATSFAYSCAFNEASGTTSGGVIRDTGGARAGSQAAWEPDLTNVSPEACETAAAKALKQKYPRVGRIVFGSDTRQLQPAPQARTSLEGQGAVQRAPGMNAVPFRYRCEYETASGKVVSVQTND